MHLKQLDTSPDALTFSAQAFHIGPKISPANLGPVVFPPRLGSALRLRPPRDFFVRLSVN
jgi:hypothetical protein